MLKSVVALAGLPTWRRNEDYIGMQITHMPGVYNSAGRNELAQPWSIGYLHDYNIDTESLNNKSCHAILINWDEQLALVAAITPLVPCIILSNVVRSLPCSDASRLVADNGNVLIFSGFHFGITIAFKVFCNTESTSGQMHIRIFVMSLREDS